MVAGFSGIIVADSHGMDSAVKQGGKDLRERRGKRRRDESSPDESSADSSKTRIRIEAAIRRVPKGKVSTYGAVARAAGFPGAARQVAGVLRRGFGEIKLRGDSAIEQRLRLEAEGVRFRGRRVDMRLCEFKFRRV